MLFDIWLLVGLITLVLIAVQFTACLVILEILE